MVERSNSAESAVEEGTLLKVVSHALHEFGWNALGRRWIVEADSGSQQTFKRGESSKPPVNVYCAFQDLVRVTPQQNSDVENKRNVRSKKSRSSGTVVKRNQVVADLLR